MVGSVPLLLALTAWLAGPAAEKKTVTAAEARANIGQDVTVCGKVVQIQKGISRSGRSWLLHIDKPAPPIFTVIMNGSTVDNPFFDADRRYVNKDICVTGHVRENNGLVHMLLTAPTHIRIVKPTS